MTSGCSNYLLKIDVKNFGLDSLFRVTCSGRVRGLDGTRDSCGSVVILRLFDLVVSLEFEEFESQRF